MLSITGSLIFFLVLPVGVVTSTPDNTDYGVDCSFPIHGTEFKCGDLLGDRKSFYEHYMAGCRKYYGNKGSRCDHTEHDRILMSQRQPQSMVVRE